MAYPTILHSKQWTYVLNVCLFGVLRRFQHCTGHITTGSWKGRGNQYIEFARVVYCKLPTNGKQLPAFPLTAMTGIDPRPQRWEARVLPLCHRGPPMFSMIVHPRSIALLVYPMVVYTRCISLLAYPTVVYTSSDIGLAYPMVVYMLWPRCEIVHFHEMDGWVVHFMKWAISLKWTISHQGHNIYMIYITASIPTAVYVQCTLYTNGIPNYPVSN